MPPGLPPLRLNVTLACLALRMPPGLVSHPVPGWSVHYTYIGSVLQTFTGSFIPKDYNNLADLGGLGGLGWGQHRVEYSGEAQAFHLGLVGALVAQV